MLGWKKKEDPKSEEEARRQAEQELNAMDIDELEKTIDKYESEKRAAFNDLEQIKDRIAKLEKNLRQKKREYDLATGGRKKILAGEYKLISDDLKGILGEPTIYEQRISNFSSLIGAAREALALKRGPSISDDVKDVGGLLDEGTRKHEEGTKSVDELNKRRKTESVGEEIDVEKDFAELMGETDEELLPSDLERDEPPLRDAVGKRRIDPLEE